MRDVNFYKTLLDRVSDGLFFVDVERRILFWNEGAYRLTGYKAEEVVGQCCPEGALCYVGSSGKGLCADGCPLEASLADGMPHEVQVFLRHRRGHRVPVTARVEPIRDDGAIIGAIQVFRDDSAHQTAQRKIEDMERLAFLDHVTGLPNRRYMEMSLRTALSEFHSHKDPFGVLMVDLDRLKSINDRFGHAVGDQALKAAAMTLVGAVRPTDIVGRWGGDEFVAIVHHVNSEILRNLIARCYAMVAKATIPLGNDESLALSVSIGEALVWSPDTAADIISRADELMYRDKLRHGRRSVMGNSVTESTDRRESMP